MDGFKAAFKSRHVILPVIHVENIEQATSNALIAFKEGSDGVFLINHRISHKRLFEAAAGVREKFPAFWMGVNCLDLYPKDVFGKISKLNFRIDGVWADNAMINEFAELQFGAGTISRAYLVSGWSGLYFGGVAFKYQRLVTELEEAARIAADFMDVVTTSGPATGEAAEVEKIRRIKSAIPFKPLAVASGITPENIQDYTPFADCFLVATGISKSFFEIDRNRLRQLIKNVR